MPAEPSQREIEEVRPVRIQRKRARGWVLPINAVVVTRPSEFGNPYKISAVKFNNGEREWWVENRNINGIYCFKNKAEAQAAAVKLFRHWVEHNAPMNYVDRAKLALKGRDLCCWCALDQPCHADVLLEIANASALDLLREGKG